MTNIDARTALSAVIARLEATSGPDRKIDCDIARSLEPLPTEPFKGPSAWDMHHGMYWIIGSMDTKDGPKENKWGATAPAYTSSVDAALKLVPQNFVPTINMFCWVELNEHGKSFNEAPLSIHVRHAQQPIIALCVAAIKARLEVQSGTE